MILEIQDISYCIKKIKSKKLEVNEHLEKIQELNREKEELWRNVSKLFNKNKNVITKEYPELSGIVNTETSIIGAEGRLEVTFKEDTLVSAKQLFIIEKITGLRFMSGYNSTYIFQID